MISRKLLCAFLITILSIEVQAHVWFGDPISDEGGTHQFHELRLAMESALEQRNFLQARGILDELYPLMKKEIKTRKKQLAHARKNELSPEEVSSLTENLVKKIHLFDIMKTLDETSSSALRVRSDHFKNMIEEYDGLLTGK